MSVQFKPRKPSAVGKNFLKKFLAIFVRLFRIYTKRLYNHQFAFGILYSLSYKVFLVVFSLKFSLIRIQDWLADPLQAIQLGHVICSKRKVKDFGVSLDIVRVN